MGARFNVTKMTGVGAEGGIGPINRPVKKVELMVQHPKLGPLSHETFSRLKGITKDRSGVLDTVEIVGHPQKDLGIEKVFRITLPDGKVVIAHETLISDRYVISYGEMTEYYRALAEDQEILGSKCTKPGHKYVFASPRSSCTEDGYPTKWIKLPSGGREGKLHSWTKTYFAGEPFLADVPYVLGMVELPGADTLLMVRIVKEDGSEIMEEELKIGMPVKAKFAGKPTYTIRDVEFVPDFKAKVIDTHAKRRKEIAKKAEKEVKKWERLRETKYDDNGVVISPQIIVRGKAASPVYFVGAGINEGGFAKCHPDKSTVYLAATAFRNALADLNPQNDLVGEPLEYIKYIDGMTASYFSDHFARQLMTGIMVHDNTGLLPKPSWRTESGGATGGMNFQVAYDLIASGRCNVVAAIGFEQMENVGTNTGNDFIARASDMFTDRPLGGIYNAYYPQMAVRHMHEFGSTREMFATAAALLYQNAYHNKFSQKKELGVTVEKVLNSQMAAFPLTFYDICVMSSGAAAAILANEEMAAKLTDKPVRITGVGCGTDAMRMADRPQGKVIMLPHEEEYPSDFKYPGVHSFRAGRMASLLAYKMAGITDPRKELDFVELHSAYTSSLIQTIEDMGIAPYGMGGYYVLAGLADIYGGLVPIDPSGGLIACGHPVGATGLMQAAFALWQLQHKIPEKFGSPYCQIVGARQGAIHSHAGTGTYVTVSILESAFDVPQEEMQTIKRDQDKVRVGIQI